MKKEYIVPVTSIQKLETETMIAASGPEVNEGTDSPTLDDEKSVWSHGANDNFWGNNWEE